MTVPAIRNYENRPPAGGWGIDYEYRGQVWPIRGHWRKVVKEIADIQSANGVYYGMDAIFDYCNPIWCSRDPARCMTPAERSRIQHLVTCRTCGGGRRR